MYCPRCGQERISEQTSFCSRCGLLLDHIGEVMENGGEPVYHAGASGREGIISRKNVRLFALLWFMVLTMFFTPIAAIMGGPSQMIAVCGAMGSVGALIIFVFSFFIPKSVPVPEYGRVPGRVLKEEASEKGLPPAQTAFAEEFVPPARASVHAEREGERPPSVTEGTTRLLKVDEQDHGKSGE